MCAPRYELCERTGFIRTKFFVLSLKGTEEGAEFGFFSVVSVRW
jgi:hypothetical protein